MSRSVVALVALTVSVATPFSTVEAQQVGQPPSTGSSQPAEAEDTAAPEAEKALLAGAWQGTLDAGVKLRIVFQIQRTAEGKLSATLDSPDQGVKGIRVDEVELVDDRLRMSVKSIGGTFEGKLASGHVVGKWLQGGASLPLDLERTEKPSEIKRPQTPQPPFPYDQRDVTYENRGAGIKLAGTLTLPRAPRPCPAVLLITGSGAQDRDETLLGHKPFLVLADYLTRRGVAVLRVDDRGVGGSSGELSKSTTADLAEDVLAGVEYLKTCPEVDSQRIGLIGHSEGGLIAPLAAVRSPDVAFIVLIAGPGVSGEEILYAQGALIAQAAGSKPEAVASQRALQERLFAVVKDLDGKSSATADLTQEQVAEQLAAAKKRLQEMIVGIAILAPEEQRKAAEATATAQIEMLLTPWFRYFLTYDPYPTLAKVSCPVLAVIGEHDLQVPPAQNLSAIERALQEGGNKDHLVRQLPGLNHLLQTSQSGAPSEYGQIEETIAPAALAVIGDWIVARSVK